MLDNLQKIVVKNPVDLIISQIRNIISSKAILPGEKLPPERKLAAQLGVSRGQVRAAINKLEFYGLVKVQPQSGTTVTGQGITAMEGIFTDVLAIDQVDFKSLVDTRILLEKEAARLAAINRTEQDLEEMTMALDAYEQKLQAGDTAVDEDLNFHIKIAEASKNTVLKSLMLIITPDIAKSFIKFKVCDDANNFKTLEEHRAILQMISKRDEAGAEKAMSVHLQTIIEFSNNFKL